MDWKIMDEINEEAGHYQVVAIRNQHKAAAMIPELLAIRESILIIDNLPKLEQMWRNTDKLRAELVEDYERKVKAIGELCDHDWVAFSGGSMHLDAGEVWDDTYDFTACSKCWMNLMYLTAPSAPEPVTF